MTFLAAQNVYMKISLAKVNHNRNAWKKKPFSSLWYVLFCLHQHSFPKILFHSLAPLQTKSQNHRIVKVVSVSPSVSEVTGVFGQHWCLSPPVQWQKMIRFTEDLFSLWPISECSPHDLVWGIQFKHHQYSNPTLLSHHVQPRLWTKILSEAPNSFPRTVCSSGKYFVPLTQLDHSDTYLA